MQEENPGDTWKEGEGTGAALWPLLPALRPWLLRPGQDPRRRRRVGLHAAPGGSAGWGQLPDPVWRQPSPAADSV